MSREKAAIWGEAAEEYAQNRYNISAARNEWRDAIYSNGIPLNIKSVSTDGEERFRLWEDDHHTLASQRGYYVFIRHTPDGEDIDVKDAIRRKASDVTEAIGGGWNDSGNHEKDQRQFKLPASDVFE